MKHKFADCSRQPHLDLCDVLDLSMSNLCEYFRVLENRLLLSRSSVVAFFREEPESLHVDRSSYS